MTGSYRPSIDDYAPSPLGRNTEKRPLSIITDITHSDDDKESLHSNTHLQTPTYKPSTRYPQAAVTKSSDDVERAPLYSGISQTPSSANSPYQSQSTRPAARWRNSELLSSIKRFEHSYEEFDSRNASEAHLAFADGDIPKDKVSRLYNYLLNVSIVTRWILFIVPAMVILWIPGILSLTEFPHATVWGVRLIWWSIWFTIAWGGWWCALALSRILPRLARATVGIVAVGSRRYIDWLEVLHRYVALFGWTVLIWASWNPLISTRRESQASKNSISALSLIGRMLFSFLLCAGVLLFEKFSIQWIAGKFHERSYAERIADLKFAVKCLVTLYRHSINIPGRTDTLEPEHTGGPKQINFLKKALRGVRAAATTTTTAFGNVASEIAGSSVLQPNSPQAMVKTALESANKSRLLARRLFYSFAKQNADYLVLEDISRFFPSQEEAEAAFTLFDKDSNGDASRDEIEMACMEFHRERLSIEHSMQDLDSAVGRLDNIFMSLYAIIVILIIAVALEAQLVTLVTGAGTMVLGLSWLIGGSLQEVLTSIIFLFIKHPFDVGDVVVISKESYTVKEIRLLSTVFLDGTGTCVQAPNTILNAQFIQNFRRSPQMSESFSFSVSYSTTFEQLEDLREHMLSFVKAERRDYLPAFDVTVVDFPDQASMTLKADIKYKSNWQQGALKAKRRNRWICALKSTLAEVKIFGPKGDPGQIPAPSRVTLVPWELVEVGDRKADKQKATEVEPRTPPGGWQLMDKKTVIIEDSEDVFGEAEEKLHMSNPRRGVPNRHPRSTTGSSPTSVATMVPESIEMVSRNGSSI